MIMWSYGHMIIWSYDRMSYDHLIIWSYEHMIIWAHGHMIIWSCDHLWSYEHMITWSYDQWSYDHKSMVMRSYGQMMIWPYDHMTISRTTAMRSPLVDGWRISGDCVFDYWLMIALVLMEHLPGYWLFIDKVSQRPMFWLLNDRAAWPTVDQSLVQHWSIHGQRAVNNWPAHTNIVRTAQTVGNNGQCLSRKIST